MAESPRAAESIDLAHVSKVGRADLIRVAIRRGKQLPINGALNNGIDVLEDVALGQNVAARSNFKGVSAGVVPVVVDRVEKGVALDFGTAATEMVDIVAFHGDQIVGSIQVNAPVVVAVAGGGVTADSVEVVVGDGHPVRSASPEDEMLAANTRSLPGIRVSQTRLGLGN